MHHSAQQAPRVLLDVTVTTSTIFVQNVGDAATDSAGSPVTVTRYMMALLGKADSKFAQVPKPLEEFARLDEKRA